MPDTVLSAPETSARSADEFVGYEIPKLSEDRPRACGHEWLQETSKEDAHVYIQLMGEISPSFRRRHSK